MKQSDKSKASREEFLKAAFQIFSEAGYEKAAVDAIIDRAGRSKGGFYHHFESKEDLFHQLFEELLEDSLQVMRQTEKLGISLRESVRMWFGLKEEQLRSKAFLKAIVELHIVAMRDPWVKKWFRRTSDAFIEMLSEVLVSAMRRGEIRNLDNPRAFAEIFYFSSRGVFMMEMILNDGKNLNEKLLRFFDQELRGLSKKLDVRGNRRSIDSERGL